MRKLSINKWEAKYIHGNVKRFDQKNHMFIRPGWDPEVNRRLKDWSFIGDIRENSGYRLEDQALRWASSRGTLMTHFNVFKPIQSPISKAVMEVLSGGTSGGSASGYRLPEGMKIDSTDPSSLTEMIKKAAIWFGADQVGICKLDQRWVYSHTLKGQQVMQSDSNLAAVDSIPQEIPEKFQYAIVTVFEMDYELMKYMPTYLANVATRMGYSRMAITNNYLTSFIKNLGYDAIDCSINDIALSIPMAMQAGLGDIARNGLLVTPKYGPRVRLNNVYTDIPLIADTPIEFGVEEFCSSCRICAEKCPSQSIVHGERTTIPHNISNIGGTLKWPVNAETCRMQWAKGHTPCAICITVCPYNKPDTLFHRLIRWGTDHVRWADPLFVKADIWAGYGKLKNADRFWEQWQPKRH